MQIQKGPVNMIAEVMVRGRYPSAQKFRTVLASSKSAAQADRAEVAGAEQALAGGKRDRHHEHQVHGVAHEDNFGRRHTVEHQPFGAGVDAAEAEEGQHHKPDGEKVAVLARRDAAGSAGRRGGRLRHGWALPFGVADGTQRTTDAGACRGLFAGAEAGVGSDLFLQFYRYFIG